MFFASAGLYAFLPAIMTVTQSLVAPRMRATAAALHAFGQTVLGLGLGSVLLGYLSDRLAARTFGPGYDACSVATVRPRPDCIAASASGLQHALMVAAVFLVIAIIQYLFAARALARET